MRQPGDGNIGSSPLTEFDIRRPSGMLFSLDGIRV